jgi:TetR/AcrR family transcriptional regulator
MSLEDFLNLPELKQKEIFRAALQEFSTYGYDLASTNRIVAQAGISKGVLFKYFTSKEGLFLYAIDRDPMPKTYMDSLSDFPDIFDYIEKMTQIEIEAIVDDPDARLFFFLVNRMILEPNHPVYAKALSRFLSPVNRIIDEYCDQVDESLLKDGLSISDLKMVLHFLLDGFRMTVSQNPDKLLADKERAIAETRMLLSIARAGMFK